MAIEATRVGDFRQADEVHGDLVDRVRGVIDRSGLTQREFARGCDLEETKLSKSLHGKRNLSSLDLAKIATFCRERRLDITVDWLLTGRTPVLGVRVCRMPADA